MPKKNWGSGARRQRLGTGEYFGTKKTLATEAVKLRTGVDPVRVRVPDHRPGRVESENSYVAAGGTRAQRMAKRITALLDKDPARQARIEAQERDTSRLSGSAKLDRERGVPHKFRAELDAQKSQALKNLRKKGGTQEGMRWRLDKATKLRADRSNRAFEEKERAIQEHYANEELRSAIKRGASFSDGEDDYTQEARDSVAAHLRKERAARQANNAKVAAQMGQKVPAGYDTLTGDKHLSEQGVKNALAYRSRAARSKPLTFAEQSKIHPNMPLATASQQRDDVRGTRMDYGGRGGSGGKGRGNWGHKGRPGKRGGSA